MCCYSNIDYDAAGRGVGIGSNSSSIQAVQYGNENIVYMKHLHCICRKTHVLKEFPLDFTS